MASLVLLAHAVIPHHHHFQEICVEVDYCADDLVEHTHDYPTHNHQHNASDDASCVINQALISSTSKSKANNSCIDCSEKHLHNYLVLFDFNNEGFDNDVNLKFEFQEVPLIYELLLSTSLDLRGPPTV